MRSWAFGLGLLLFPLVSSAGDTLLAFGTPMISEKSRDLQMEAISVSKSDGIGAGWCGRGVLHVLRTVGLGDGLVGGNGHDWEEILEEAGWEPISCVSPEDAPFGSVLVFQSDYNLLGRNKRGTPGGRWGHVEFVAADEDGKRWYVSDAPRTNFGGTVPDNFTSRAWVPPGGRILDPRVILEVYREAVRQELMRLVVDRLEVANWYFQERR